MNFLLIGDPGAPVVLLIHGMATAAELCYAEVARSLSRKYRVVLACLDGHDPYKESIFQSLGSCCEKIERYVRKRFGGEIFAMSGFGLGGTVAVELMKRNLISVSRVHIDSSCCINPGLSKVPLTLVYTKGAGFMSKGHKLPASVVGKVFGKDNYSVTDLLYKEVAPESLSNACREVFSYKLSPRLERCTADIEFWCGSSDKIAKKSARSLGEFFPDMRVRVFRDLGHGEMLNLHKQAYVRELGAFLERDIRQ